jgi:hypothetical protein
VIDRLVHHIAWRNRHVENQQLRRIVARANVA